MIPLRLIATLGGALIVMGAVHGVLRAEREKGRAECQAVYARAALEAQMENQRLTAKAMTRNQEIANAYRKTTGVEAAVRAGSSGQLERMRRLADAAAADRAIASPAGAASGVDAASDIGRLLAEGAGLAEEGRSRVAELAAQVTGLQDYAATVCQP